jgi:MFS family permease
VAVREDLDTTVQGVQIAITVFLLVMAALMIPGGKLTDRYGRKRCFTAGLVIYGIGALLGAAAPGLGVLIIGNSILEGVGTALLIPPVYILATLLFTGSPPGPARSARSARWAVSAPRPGRCSGA